MSISMGNYEELLATFADWIKWLREKKATLEAQKNKQDAAKRKPEKSVAPVAAFNANEFSALAGMDAPPEAPVAPMVEELPAEEGGKTVPEAPVAPVVEETPAEEDVKPAPETPVAPVREPAKGSDFPIAPVFKPAEPPKPAAPPPDDDELA